MTEKDWRPMKSGTRSTITGRGKGGISHGRKMFQIDKKCIYKLERGKIIQLEQDCGIFREKVQVRRPEHPGGVMLCTVQCKSTPSIPATFELCHPPGGAL